MSTWEIFIRITIYAYTLLGNAAPKVKWLKLDSSNPKLSLSRFVIHKRQFSILILISVVVINFPVIFSSSEIRANMIDLTAIAGAVVTVFVFFTITLMKSSESGRLTDFCLFFIGTLLWLVVKFTFAYYREGLGVEVPYPSFADLFWLLGYGFFLFHNYSVIAKLRGILTIDRSMIILVSAAVGLTLGYILNLTFGVAEILSSTTDSLSFGVSVFYPIIDGILLIPSIIIFWSLRKRRSFSHALVFNVCILCHGNNWRYRIWL